MYEEFDKVINELNLELIEIDSSVNIISNSIYTTLKTDQFQLFLKRKFFGLFYRIEIDIWKCKRNSYFDVGSKFTIGSPMKSYKFLVPWWKCKDLLKTLNLKFLSQESRIKLEESFKSYCEDKEELEDDKLLSQEIFDIAINNFMPRLIQSLEEFSLKRLEDSDVYGILDSIECIHKKLSQYSFNFSFKCTSNSSLFYVTFEYGVSFPDFSHIFINPDTPLLLRVYRTEYDVFKANLYVVKENEHQSISLLYFEPRKIYIDRPSMLAKFIEKKEVVQYSNSIPKISTDLYNISTIEKILIDKSFIEDLKNSHKDSIDVSPYIIERK